MSQLRKCGRVVLARRDDPVGKRGPEHDQSLPSRQASRALDRSRADNRGAALFRAGGVRLAGRRERRRHDRELHRQGAGRRRLRHRAGGVRQHQFEQGRNRQDADAGHAGRRRARPRAEVEGRQDHDSRNRHRRAKTARKSICATSSPTRSTAGKAERWRSAAWRPPESTRARPVSVKSGALRLEGLDVADALKAVGASAGTVPTGPPRPLDAGSRSTSSRRIRGARPARRSMSASATVEHRNDYAGDAFKRGLHQALRASSSSRARFRGSARASPSFGYSKVELSMVVGATTKPTPRRFRSTNFTDRRRPDGLGCA